MARKGLYYDPGTSRRSGRRRGRISSSGTDRATVVGPRRYSLLDWMMLIVSVVIAAGVVLSWAARWIDPETYGVLSAAGLFMPVLFVANFIALLYWTIRWRTGVFIPLAVFVTGIWGMSMFFRPQLAKHGPDLSNNRSLVDVMTYNVRGMMRPAEDGSGRLRSSMNDVVAVVDSLGPDILCIQEFQSTTRYPGSDFEAALPVYHYKRVRFNVAGTEEGNGWGNAIFSKFPITDSGWMDFEGTNNSILWADVAVGRDTMRVFCAHLQTTAIKASDERYIVDMDFVTDSTRTSQMRRMVGTLTRNYVIRSGQADTLAASISSSPHPVVVCGDFNDTPASYSYRKIARRLKDSFREAGRGYGYTYRGFFDLLRIDYVLHSREMESVEYLSPSFDNSDHNPVAVRIRMK